MKILAQLRQFCKFFSMILVACVMCLATWKSRQQSNENRGRMRSIKERKLENLRTIAHRLWISIYVQYDYNNCTQKPESPIYTLYIYIYYIETDGWPSAENVRIYEFSSFCSFRLWHICTVLITNHHHHPLTPSLSLYMTFITQLLLLQRSLSSNGNA